MRLEIRLDAAEIERYEIEFNHTVKTVNILTSKTCFDVETKGTYSLIIRQRVVPSSKTILHKIVHRKLTWIEFEELMGILLGGEHLEIVELFAYRTELCMEVELIEDTKLQINGVCENLNQEQTLKKQVFTVEKNAAINNVQITYTKDISELERNYKLRRHISWFFGGLVELLFLYLTVGAILNRDVACFIVMLILFGITTGFFAILNYVLKTWYLNLKQSIGRLQE